VAYSRRPAALAVLTVMASVFSPLLQLTNPPTYDTSQFYNAALSVLVGCLVAALSFALLPPLSPAVRARRLLALTLRDLRRLAVAPMPPRWTAWEGRAYGRLAAMPDPAEPVQRARLLAALSIGSAIIHLRHTAPRLGLAAELDSALADFADANSASAIARLRDLDHRLAAPSDGEPPTPAALRARGRILVVAEALARHAPYFDAGAVA